MVQPSLYEGFGLTVVEAMAAKIPVLVSNIEGPMEIVKKGKFGYFFENGNVIDCANGIDKILDLSNAINDKMLDSAYLHAKHNFDIKTTAKIYLKKYV